MEDPLTGPHSPTSELRGQLDLRFITQLTKRSYAIILAGGRGSRLENLTDWRAKPAVPFAGKFRIIDFTLSNCVNSGIRRIGVATQYKSQSLIRHIQAGWSFLDGRLHEFIDLLPAQQQVHESWYKGTADAVFQNLDLLRRNRSEFVLVLSGDHVYKMDYGKMLASHVQCGADLTIACHEVPIADARAFGVMGTDAEGRITSFQEKPEQPVPISGRPGYALASMGVYVFNTRFLFEQLIKDADTTDSGHDFGRDIIPGLIGRYGLFAHRFADSCVDKQASYWRDVGTVDAYWEANIDLTKVVPQLDLYDLEWPIWTYQEQLPPAKFVFDEDGRRGMAVDSLVSGGCIISGATVRRSLLFSSVRIEARASVEDSVILPSVEIGRGAIIKRAVLDRRCKIPEGMVVGVDPDEDRRRFHVTAKGITLITPEMLGQRIHQLR
ncbi:glucose-1-phosphate adenylyltransferase [mine drainage metagenome]|uniref:Glucose-1-phosphate adenylyltransferase n=1 Tax=mine drainage metagenome TaxID=410659 RepID=A0A1J5SBT4_9ZZZZ